MISVVIPVYNEEDIIEKNIKEVKVFMDTLNQRWELVVVDDCSTDRTLEKLLKAKKTMLDAVRK